ncbi:NUDIX hydrolase [Streptomyces sp. ISL-100]|uniref:NUDIX hydrolase n=1 Tax=Streptomyces sp. ISL-100 TaxID=2819173 RepID=UPI001BE5A042|nr:NUDIX hydrolase [Streptomyces sp. ISL-100]MBT2395648.1 NUDIX hydrolase [Streptomyces sp. ISL-100]
MTNHTPDASVIVAVDGEGLVAILTADFPDHGGEYLFLPGGRMEDGESPEGCARRELAEEAGITAERLTHLGSFAITLGNAARIHLYQAQGLTLGPQQLMPGEADFKLTWWPMQEAVQAGADGRFLLQGGPLALLLADRASQETS